MKFVATIGTFLFIVWVALFSGPTHSSDDVDTLTKAIYFEANAEPYKGKVAIAFVVLHRVKSKYFPNTIHKVVYQNNKPGTKFCQFSWTCDGKEDIIPKGKVDAIKEIAIKAIAGELKDPVNGADHFHNDSVNPPWAKRLKRVARIGGHTFYRRD